MAGYLGTKAVLLSTTAADVVGNAEIGGDLTVGGNVGIGTSPSKELHVKNLGSNSVGDSQLLIEGGTGGYGAGVSFQSQLTGGSLAEMARITADGESSWNTTASTQYAGLRFYTSLGGTVAERMRVDSYGRVGIGTGSPSTALHVSTPVTTKSVVETTGTSSDALIEFTRGQGSGNTWSVGLDQSNSSALSFAYLANGSPSLTSHNKMTIDASGNVGIGTTSPSTKIDAVGSTSTSSGIVDTLRLRNTGVAGGDGAKIQFTAGTSTSGAGIGSGGVALNSADLRFYSGGNTERMRIDGAGRVMIGTTSATDTGVGGATFHPQSYDRDILALGSSTALNGAELLWFYNPNGKVGRIETNANSTSYVTTSDYRLKTDAQPMTGASARVQALNPVNFEWISDGTRVDGFLAHEAQDVVPEAVSGTKDAMRDEEYEVTPAVYEDVVIPAVLDEEGNELEAERTEQRLASEAVMGTRSVPDYQGIDQSKLVPLLTAALQEALTEIADLKARVTALEAV